MRREVTGHAPVFARALRCASATSAPLYAVGFGAWRGGLRLLTSVLHFLLSPFGGLLSDAHDPTTGPVSLAGDPEPPSPFPDQVNKDATDHATTLIAQGNRAFTVFAPGPHFSQGLQFQSLRPAGTPTLTLRAQNRHLWAGW